MPRRTRKLSPPKNLPYQKYKPYLRQDCAHQCCYCDSTEPEIGGSKRFHVDHYKPKRFRASRREYKNLLYACPECNINKSDYWPTWKDRLDRKIVLDPFVHDVDKHIDKRSFKWSGRTPQGDFNVLFLRLDNPKLVGLRQDRETILQMISEIEVQLHQCQRTLALMDLQNPNVEAEVKSLDLACAQYRRRIDSLKARTIDPMD